MLSVQKSHLIGAGAERAATGRAATMEIRLGEKEPDAPRQTRSSSQRLFAIALLATAVVIGAGLRFHQLTLASMNGDEGASWAAAVAHSVHKVVKAQERLDPGKLAVYAAVLHGWI